MSIPATLYGDPRSDQRHALDRASTLRDEQHTPIDMWIEDLSASGFRMRLPFVMEAGRAISIGVPGIGVRAARVIWSRSGQAGCMFDTALTPAEVRAVLVFDSPLVQGPFADPLPVESAQPEAEEPAGFSPRRKLAIIVAGALAAWALATGLVQIILVIARAFF